MMDAAEPIDVPLNQLAQGLVPAEKGTTWFAASDEQGQAEILIRLSVMVQQTHPNQAEIQQGISRSGVKSTRAVAALLAREPLSPQLRKARALPRHEWPFVFRVLLAVFAVADARRRTSNELCRSGRCHHWWDGDLEKSDWARLIESPIRHGDRRVV
jgi:hypothetical protein